MALIIDIHTHMFPEKIAQRALQQLQHNCHTALFSDGTETGLIRTGCNAGITLSVVQPVATNPEKVSHINDEAMLINSRTQTTGIMSFGAMHPDCPYWEAELERLKQSGVPGIKLHPPYQKADIDSPRSVAILRKCRDLGLTVLIHSGRDVGIPDAEESMPEKVRNALDRVGPIKLIAAHMGGWRCWSEAIRLLSATGIYIDTAFSIGQMTPAGDGYVWKEQELQMLAAESFSDFVSTFGTDHILFGTDNPWSDPSRELRKIKELPLTPEELERILFKNTYELLDLEAVMSS